MGSVSAQESLKMEEKANQRGGSWGGSAQSWQLWRWRKGPQAKECRQPLSRRWKSFHPKSLPKECSLTNTLILASLNFELWCWRRLLRGPWTARRSNQSILKEISPGCALEGMMLKLKLQYFGHLMGRVDSLEKTDAGRDWGQEEKGTTEDEMAGWHHQLNGRESEWTPGVGDEQGNLVCCNSWGHKESDTSERLNWTEIHFRLLTDGTIIHFFCCFN